MKKLGFLVIMFICLLSKDVFAKDTTFYLSQYEEENFLMMEKSYNEEKKIDGFLVGGEVLKEIIEQDEKTYPDYQVILVKYDKEGNLVWSLSYGDTKEDHLYFMDYTYNDSSEIDGYLIGVEKTYPILEEVEDHSMTTFLKVNLQGEIEWEKSSSLNRYEKIQKLIPLFQENTFQGYIGIGMIDEDEKAMILRYNENLELLWMKEYYNEEFTKKSFLEIQPIFSKEQVITGYVLLMKGEKEDSSQTKLLRYDLEGNHVKTIIDTIEYDTFSLASSNEGYFLYGMTSEVKLKKGENSYYLIHYFENDEQDWEVVGNIPVSSLKPLFFQSIENGYIFLSKNSVDQTYEVIQLDQEGLYQKKMKKIPNNYYDFHDFEILENVLYFVGQIQCPEDDDCYHNLHAVFLRSDEDKVIEVEDNTSTNILLVLLCCVISSMGVIYYRKKKQ